MTTELTTLPNFLLPGAMKCGTTSLANQLASHPDVFMPGLKELHFFSSDEKWVKGVGWYQEFFRGAEEAEAVGEASTTYTMYPVVDQAADRIHRTLGDVRYVYVVRNPLDRLVSHCMHLWYRGTPRRPLEEMIERRPDLIDYGRYYLQIEQYLPFSSPERWHIVLFEDFVRDPESVVPEVFAFLGVDPSFVPPDRSPRNVTADKEIPPHWARRVAKIPFLKGLGRRLLPGRILKGLKTMGRDPEPPEITSDLRRELVARYREDVVALSDLVGRDLFSFWQMD
ncbi:MAG: sulfotransferase [bacterium]